MTPDDVLGRCKDIIKLSGDDDELAHRAEKRLWHDVLKEVANGNPDSDLLAKLALKTLEIDFSRWFA